MPSQDVDAGEAESTDRGAAGRWLIEHRGQMDRGEYCWLEALGEFDARRRFERDGQRSSVEWLRWKTKMATSTCYEKVHLAAALRARPVVAAAFRDGRISYSAARLICRMEDPDPATDTAVVEAATRSTVRQLEYLVAHYEQLADQERPPPDPDLRRGVRKRILGDGWAKIEVTLPEVEADELLAAIEACAAVARRDDHSAQAEDGAGAPGGPAGEPVEDPAEDGVGSPVPEAESEGASASAQAEDGDTGGADLRAARVQAWRATRVDGLLDLARIGLAHADGGHAAGDDRYLLHLVAGAGGRTTTLDGRPIDPATAARIACDASMVNHATTAGGEPLFLGRKRRVWSVGQRRAALVRDGGHCRFPGCERRHVDLHHRIAWEDDGPTDITNALAICRHHHVLLHHGFTTTAEAGGAVAFHRPDGSHLGTTYPVAHQLGLAA